MTRPAVFLDRDGTLNREVDYLARPEDLELLPRVGAALRSLAEAGFALVVVTNQSGIARGLFTLTELALIHERLHELLAAQGVELDAIEFCPHHPEFTGPCTCRKPAPGMLLRAVADLDLDPAASWIVGDSERDLAAGRAIGARGILVLTGKGEAEAERMRRAGRPPEGTAPDLAAAAASILAHP